MKNRFRIGILFRLACLIVGILLFAYFLPVGVYRFHAHRIDVTTFVLFLLLVAAVSVLLAVVALYYRFEIGESQLTVRAIFVIGQIDIGSILYVQQIGEILPLCIFGVDKGLAGQTVRYAAVVRPWVEFMATLKQRNQAIRFSKRNEKRIAAYLSNMRE